MAGKLSGGKLSGSRDLRTFCRWFNLSRFTYLWEDQSDHKFVLGGPQLMLRAGCHPQRGQLSCEHKSHGNVTNVLADQSHCISATNFTGGWLTLPTEQLHHISYSAL